MQNHYEKKLMINTLKVLYRNWQNVKSCPVGIDIDSGVFLHPWLSALGKTNADQDHSGN